ncbi:MAG: EF-hand domain-containing protein [Sphingomonadales bacterium]|nr:EF-hand domain-containing protein [Sphingomonadales bacterium]
MTKARKIALGLSLAATAVAGAAFAQQAMQNDRAVTRAEAQAKAQEMFTRMDANHDGKLDQADREARRAAMFDRMDADHNGQISRAEFDAMAPHGPGGPGGPDGGPGGPGMHRWGGAGGHMGRGHHGGGMMMMGRMADADKDGSITQAEFTQAALQRFDAADANHDGTVTGEERQAARKAMHERMRERWQNRAGQPA